MERGLNRIAVLARPEDRAAFWEYPVERGLHDRRHHYSHGGKYGNGGFTGERCMLWNGVPHFFRLEDHDARLLESVAAYRYLDLACTRELRDEARFTLAAQNYGDNYVSLVFESQGDVGVMTKNPIPLVYANSRDMDPVTKPYLPLAAMQRGLRVMICNPEDAHRRYPTRLTLAKTSPNYGDSNVAKFLAMEVGCDDGILLDHTFERIAELSVSNLILVEDHRLITPFRESAPLNGITKQTVGTLAAERYGFPLMEEPVPLTRLRPEVRAAFATGTAIGVVKIRSIFDHTGNLLWELQDPEAEKLVDNLSADYWRLLRGEEPGYHAEWFTPVPMTYLERYVPKEELAHLLT
jgi:branched-chain amino acid aminotransferase